jgi:hypothetical protein
MTDIEILKRVIEELKARISRLEQGYITINNDISIAGKVRPFVPVRVQSNDGTTTRTYWLGLIEIIAVYLWRVWRRHGLALSANGLEHLQRIFFVPHK